MNPPRGLTEAEAAAWARLAGTVKPLDRVPVAKTRQPDAGKAPSPGAPMAPPPPPPAKGRVPPPPPPRPAPVPAPPTKLDSHWNRRLARGEPDFTLDLHGHTLDQAWQRLDRGLRQARAMEARVVLVVTGKSRPVDPADRGSRRGAIRAKILDWLAAGPHAAHIAAVKPAARRHGGEGALYLVLRRQR
ncbi:Smr/MutS family protein [Aurantiacibacter spongiae]|uniref:DNA mismatch repair protein MutS n=1 Tax=Aurantiacibacter spongiae TaxID=2488860 RepID=A0A3N5CU46_9SPHN|nr:Smr/MutS family protein [Aurantiacibacter spongiae]RPF71846.1 DNA mismatch repair protein MutS [Aurantiacibacter spongiae]